MSDRSIVTLVPRDTPPARPLPGRTTPEVDSAVAPLVPLRPVTMHSNVVQRLIEPLHVPARTQPHEEHRPAPGPLARALLTMAGTDR